MDESGIESFKIPGVQYLYKPKRVKTVNKPKVKARKRNKIARKSRRNNR